MQRLKNPQMQIPNGFFFRQPEINWDSRKVLGLHPSLDVLTRALISARAANPHQVGVHKWSLEFPIVRQEVELFQVKICLANRWTKYLTDGGGGAPPPLSKAQSILNVKQLSAAAGKVKKLWAGVRTLNEWLDSEEPPVETALSESRAATCVACPLNGKGDFTAWFTTPAAAAIKRQIERMQQRNISGTLDDKLGICEACLCPNVLKTKTPMKFIKPHLSDEVIQELKVGKDCWIISES